MRLFVALPLDEEVRSSLYRDLEESRRTLGGIKWVRPEALHITLVFLGEVRDDTVEELKRTLDGIELPSGTFPLRLEGFGQFPPRGPARILYCGVGEGAERIKGIYQAVAGGLQGFYREKGKNLFTPHVTIARTGRSGRYFFSSGDFPKHGYTLKAESVVLFRSMLYSTGAEYLPVWRRTFRESGTPFPNSMES